MKVVKFDGTRTYMFPNGTLAAPEVMRAKFDAIDTFAHIITTDDNEEVCFAVENLSAVRSREGIDHTLSEADAIAAIEVIVNTPRPEPGPSPEERIASALEFQNLMSL